MINNPVKALLAICLFFVASCSNEPSAEQLAKDSIDRANQDIQLDNTDNFKQFISKFKMLQLPLIMEPFDMQEKLGTTYIYGADTLFINTEYKDTASSKVYAYGMLADTTNIYKLVYFVPAEVYVPMLATFSKDGKLIANIELYIGQCGSDCGLTCKETITIDAAMNIHSTDSIQSSKCDGKGPIAGTMKKYVLFKTGSIDKDGKVFLSEMKKEGY